ncbi:protein NAR1 [Citrus sinensis]|uniref:Protein NAR1 n=1 Tax=Citrus sinensis TaxID=2711 RepID=A0ACB8ILL8_CITSI|nr:protein NAR1 [Citrus sinensis]
MYGVEVASVPLAIETSYEGHLYGVAGSSGGYAETIFRHAAKTLFGKVIEGHLEFKTIRNSDFREVALEVEGKTLLKFALFRRVKMRKCDYHFVEVMACPSGCMNGGGQVKPKPGQSPKELIKTLETIYLENVMWLEQPGSEKAKKHVHTEYYPVVKSITAQLHNW